MEDKRLVQSITDWKLLERRLKGNLGKKKYKRIVESITDWKTQGKKAKGKSQKGWKIRE